jgi:membrane protease YdiL (CAAX protease family)
MLASEPNVMKGWQYFSLIVPLVLAPAMEKIGWRGYGIDSLRAHFNLLSTSMMFALLWGLWHLPLFFIKGYYQYELWQSSFIYWPISSLANSSSDHN